MSCLFQFLTKIIYVHYSANAQQDSIIQVRKQTGLNLLLS